MDIRRSLQSFVHDRFGSHSVDTELSYPDFSQRPGMHQPVEDQDASLFSRTDLDLLRQMGIGRGTGEPER